MKVWLLWESEANDHQVIGVFESEAGAKAAALERYRGIAGAVSFVSPDDMPWRDITDGGHQEVTLRMPLAGKYYWFIDPCETQP